LWNHKVYYRVYKSSPLICILIQNDPAPTTHPPSLRSISVLSTHLRLGLPSGFCPSGCPTNVLHAFLFSPIRSSQRIRPVPRPFVTFRNSLYFLRRGVVYLTPNLQTGGTPLVDCSLLFIECIRSYHPYLEAVSSLLNLRTRDLHLLTAGNNNTPKTRNSIDSSASYFEVLKWSLLIILKKKYATFVKIVHV
jgi:hypothetical protein